jgi:hypothetical protein
MVHDSMNNKNGSYLKYPKYGAFTVIPNISYVEYA